MVDEITPALVDEPHEGVIGRHTHGGPQLAPPVPEVRTRASSLVPSMFMTGGKCTHVQAVDEVKDDDDNELDENFPLETGSPEQRPMVDGSKP